MLTTPEKGEPLERASVADATDSVRSARIRKVMSPRARIRTSDELHFTMESRPILFDHLPKTGGMAIHALMQSILGADRCSPIITGSLYDARAAFDRFDVVSGHFYYHPGSDLSDLWTLTLLRHPVERIISHYFYAQLDVGPSGDMVAQMARTTSFDDYVASEDPRIVASIANVMVYHFASMSWDGVAELTPERALALARAALDRFDLVGLTERMNETADLLCRARGWPPVREVPALNTSLRKPRPEAIAPATRKRLLENNALDLELYQYACKLYDRTRQRMLFEGISAKPTVPAPPPEAQRPVRRPGLDVIPPAAFGTREVELVRIDVYAQSGAGPLVLSGEVATLRVVFRARVPVDDLTVGIHVRDQRLQTVFATNTRYHGYVLAAAADSQCEVSFSMRVDLGPGRYWVGASLHPSHSHVPRCFHWEEAVTPFDVVGKLGWHFEGATKLYPEFEFAGVTATRVGGEMSSPDTQFLGRVPPMLTDFRQQIVIGAPVPGLLTSQLVAHPVEVGNTGAERWPSMGERAVRLTYHWYDRVGAMTVFDGERTLLPHDLHPGDRVTLWASIRAPDQPGEYILVWSLVQESVGWFIEFGAEPVTQVVPVAR